MARASTRTMRLWAAVARLSLVVSLWHAPVPWVHQHSAGMSDLPAHLATHHAHDHGDSGWHMHCELPLWGHTDHDGGPTDEHGPSGRLFFDPATSTPSEIGLVGAVAVSTMVDLPPRALSPAAALHGGTFLQSLLRRTSAQPVFGRCQC